MNLDPWRPSEYTAFLIDTLQTKARHLVRGNVLELGIGSGVVLAALGALGAESLVGTDIDPAAIARAASLLDHHGCRAELLTGDLWAPLEGRRFDLIVANPPHFPAAAISAASRPASWSNGGPDGRRVVDPLLAGLRRHLADGGHAILVHSAFLGLARTRDVVAREGLALRCLASTMMLVAPEKRAVMTPAVLEGAGPDVLQHLGDYSFATTHVVEISATVPNDG